MYKVIKTFTDLQDNGYKYRAGDVYPRPGYTASDERIEELSGYENKRKTPLIEHIEVENKNEAATIVEADKDSQEDFAENIEAELENGEAEEEEEHRPRKRKRTEND